MKNRLSSFFKAVTGSQMCGICAVTLTVLAVVVVWQVITMVMGHVQEHVALQNFVAWQR